LRTLKGYKAVCFSVVLNLMWIGCLNSLILVIDPKNLGWNVTVNLDEDVSSLLPLPEQAVVWVGLNGPITVIDNRRFETKKQFQAHSQNVHCMELANNNQVWTSSLDNNIKIWNILTGDCLHQIDLKGVSHLTYQPEFMWCGITPNSIIVYNTTTHEEFAEYPSQNFVCMIPVQIPEGITPINTNQNQTQNQNALLTDGQSFSSRKIGGQQSKSQLQIDPPTSPQTPPPDRFRNLDIAKTRTIDIAQNRKSPSPETFVKKPPTSASSSNLAQDLHRSLPSADFVKKLNQSSEIVKKSSPTEGGLVQPAGMKRSGSEKSVGSGGDLQSIKILPYEMWTSSTDEIKVRAALS